jgi:alpha 1,3-glucosidase
VRPLWWEFAEERFADVDDVAMLGPALLVAPFLNPGNKSLTVHLPLGRWYAFGSLREVARTVTLEYEGGRTPVFQRGGTIVPMRERIRRSSFIMQFDPYNLVIALDKDQKAEGGLYIDDGSTFSFEQGGYIYRRFIFNNDTLTSEAIGKSAIQSYEVLIERVRIAGLARKPQKVSDRKGLLRFEWNKGILIIHRPQFLVRENLNVTLKF